MGKNILFESVLRDAIFVPLMASRDRTVNIVRIYEGKVSHVRAANRMGYWTLKFDNGAVLPVWSGPDGSGSLWWIGVNYRVSEGPDSYDVELSDAAESDTPH
jgi:hypothetical protein